MWLTFAVLIRITTSYAGIRGTCGSALGPRVAPGTMTLAAAQKGQLPQPTQPREQSAAAVQASEQCRISA